MTCYLSEKEAIRLFGNTDVIGMPVTVTVGGRILEYTIVGLTGEAENTSLISFDYEDSPIF